MTPDQIEEYIVKKDRKGKTINIHFKDRLTVTGIFINSKDYHELRSKNFWRVVSDRHAEEWKRTGDETLARIFNGTSFTKLSEPN